jgi:hypothetical protein
MILNIHKVNTYIMYHTIPDTIFDIAVSQHFIHGSYCKNKGEIHGFQGKILNKEVGKFHC